MGGDAPGRGPVQPAAESAHSPLGLGLGNQEATGGVWAAGLSLTG
jgi:hypothetical protein